MTKQDKRNAAVTGLVMLAFLMTSMSTAGADVLEVTGDLSLDDGCVGEDDGIDFSVLEESEWQLATDEVRGDYASKTFTVDFESQGFQVLPGDGPGAPDVSARDCTAGSCAVIVHVYEKAVASVKAHAGLFGFLPWAYAKVTATQEVQVDVESEIHCEGEAFVVLRGSGGVGPRVVTASFWKDEVTQVYEQCHYLNVELDDYCTLVFTEPFEVTARTPGEYTRFDVINGGRYSNRPSAEAGVALAEVIETPAIDVMGIEEDPALLSKAGQWRVIYKGITISVDTQEALALLQPEST